MGLQAIIMAGGEGVRTAETPPLPEPGETGFLLAPDGESVSLFTRDTVYAPEQTALLRLLLLHREQGTRNLHTSCAICTPDGCAPWRKEEKWRKRKKTPRFRFDKMRRAAYNNTVEASWGVRQRSVFTHIS